MPDPAFKKHVHQLIADDRLETAVDELSRYWSGRHRGLHAAMLQTSRRLRALRDRQVKGTVSQADADVERARITEVLLAAAEQVDQPAPELPPEMEAGAPAARTSRWLLAAGALIAAFLLFGYFFRNGTAAPAAAPFQLELYLQTVTDGAPRALSGGRVEVLLGDYPLPVAQANAAGGIVFDGLPAEYLDDTVRVLPVDMRYRVVRQSAFLPGASRRITVELAPLPDTTVWRGVVVTADNDPVSGARIDIESGLAEAVTDERGYFNAAVPRPDGERVQVEVFYRGRRMRDAAYTLTGTEPARIILQNLRINDQRTQR